MVYFDYLLLDNDFESESDGELLNDTNAPTFVPGWGEDVEPGSFECQSKIYFANYF